MYLCDNVIADLNNIQSDLITVSLLYNNIGWNWNRIKTKIVCIRNI